MFNYHLIMHFLFISFRNDSRQTPPIEFTNETLKLAIQCNTIINKKLKFYNFSCILL